MTSSAHNRVPSYDQLLNPTLSSLPRLGGSASIPELVGDLISQSQLPMDVVDIPHPGRANLTELEYRLMWARTYLKKYGLITNSARGIWALTAQGTVTPSVNPQEVIRFVRQSVRPEEADPPETSDPLVSDVDGSADAWREELRSALYEMSPDGFERLCQLLLRESGFVQVEVTGRSGDGGIDGHGILRLVGLISFPVVFQCKRYQSNVSAPAVRELRGAMAGRADKGLLITTGGFTRDAKSEATRDGAPLIDLIDGEQLMDRLKELGLGVRTNVVEVVEIDTEWFLKW